MVFGRGERIIALHGPESKLGAGACSILANGLEDGNRIQCLRVRYIVKPDEQQAYKRNFTYHKFNITPIPLKGRILVTVKIGFSF